MFDGRQSDVIPVAIGVPVVTAGITPDEFLFASVDVIPRHRRKPLF